MRVVFDTNIFVSALVFPDGRANAAIYRILDGHDELLLSPAILDEVLRVLADKFSREKEELSRVAVLLGDMAEVMRLKRSIHVLADEPDNRILECAVAGGVDLIVTGVRTKKVAVEVAMRDFVRRRKTRKLLALEGPIELADDRRLACSAGEPARETCREPGGNLQHPDPG